MPRYTSLAQFKADASPTPAELQLIKACLAADPCVLSKDRPTAPTPENTIRADLLRLLITGASSACGLPDDGVWLEGAWITGTLDLSFAKARGKTLLPVCHFSDKPRLTQTRLQMLNLDGSYLPGLFAQGMVVHSSVFLRKTTTTGTVDVAEAKIGAQLDCEGSTLDGKGDWALNGQRLQVSGGFLWRKIKVAQGQVYLASAHVGDLVDDIDSWPTGQGRLYLDGFTYDRISGGATTDAKSRLDWLKTGTVGKRDFYPQPYSQLARVLAEMGHDRDARKVLEERSRLLGIASRARRPEGWQRRHYLNPFCYITFVVSWLFDRLSQLVVGYGHAPHRALYSLTFLFLIATALASAAWNEGSFAPNSDVVLTSPGWTNLVATDCVPEPTDGCLKNPAAAWSSFGQDGLDWDTFNSIGYGLDLVVPILTLGQTDAWAPSKDRGPMGKLLWWGRWVLISFGWIVSALGAAAITGIIQQK